MTLCIPLCICRLTLAWISSEISTKLLGMPTHLDRSSLTASGLYLMWLVSQMSGSTPNRHSTSPVANWVPLSNSLLAFSSYFRSHQDLESKHFVWFRVKTDKGIVCLADHQHSVTPLRKCTQNRQGIELSTKSPVFTVPSVIPRMTLKYGTRLILLWFKVSINDIYRNLPTSCMVDITAMYLSKPSTQSGCKTKFNRMVT